MKAVEVLTNARALIANESSYVVRGRDERTPGRIRGSVYRDRRGNDILQLKNATCFCSLGAINAAVGADAESYTCGLYKTPFDDGDAAYRELHTTAPTKSQRNAYWAAMKYLREAVGVIAGYKDVVKLNDSDGSGTHARVLAAFDLAIKNAKRRHINGKRYAGPNPTCTLA